MKKLNLLLQGQEMLSKEQMKKVTGGGETGHCTIFCWYGNDESATCSSSGWNDCGNADDLYDFCVVTCNDITAPTQVNCSC